MDSDLARRLIRPTIDTKFHIDYQWWDRADRDLDVYMRSHLCPAHQEDYKDLDASSMVDHVDPKTGEVTRVPAIQNVLITHCSQQADYLTPQTSLINAIFRAFMANGNTPLSSRELGARVERSPEMILRTLSGQRVYKGIRPVIED
jgi:hypothetical protein